MAQIPGSIRVTGYIAPTDSTDIYATHDSKYGRGGLREVADLTERDAITADRRKEGMCVYVVADGQTYQLVGGVDNANWVIFGNAAATLGSYVITVNDMSGAVTLVGGNGIEVVGGTISVSADYALNSTVADASSALYTTIYDVSAALSQDISDLTTATVDASSALYTLVGDVSSSLYTTIYDVSGSLTQSITDLTTATVDASSALYTLVGDTSAVLYTLVGDVSGVLHQEIVDLTTATVDASSALYTLVGDVSATLHTETVEASSALYTLVGDVSATIDANFVHRTGSVDENVDGEKNFIDNAVFAGSVTISGDLYVAGSTTTVASSAVSVADRIITVNAGEPGVGVTNLYAGMEVDRGTGAPYYMVFDELRDAFVVGTPGGPVTDAGTLMELQVVATREDAPLDKSIAFWQEAGSPSGGHTFVTNANFTYDATTGLDVNAIVYNPSVAGNWSVAPDDVFEALDTLAATDAAAATTLADISAALHTEIVDSSAALYTLVGDTSAVLYTLVGDVSGVLHQEIVDLTTATVDASSALYTLVGDVSATLHTETVEASSALYTLVGDTSAVLYTLVGDVSATLHTETVEASSALYTLVGDTSAVLYTLVGDTSSALYTLVGDVSATLHTETVEASSALYTLVGDVSGTLQTQIDNLADTYVTLGTAQTVTGAKTFISAIDIALASSASSPLTVNASGLVTYFNADMLDDKHYSDIISDATSIANAYTDASVSAASGNIMTYIGDVLTNINVTTDSLSAAIDNLGDRVTTLEVSSNNHEVRIDNLESSVDTIANSLSSIMQGKIVCDTTNYKYSVVHPSLDIASSFPMISLTVPTSSSVLYIQGVTNRSATGFDIVLSDVPDVMGYEINWTMPLSGSAVVVRAYGISSTTIADATYSPNAGANDTFELNYSGDCTVAVPTSMADGQTINIIANGAAGSTLDWTGYMFSGGEPTATADGTDVFTILKKGSLYLVTYSLDFN